LANKTVDAKTTSFERGQQKRLEAGFNLGLPLLLRDFVLYAGPFGVALALRALKTLLCR
jgi:hypothetical protein